MLLKDKLDFIFKNSTNFNRTGKNVFKMFAKRWKKINYNNLFFSTGHESVAKDVDFLEKYGTLYDLLIYLLENPMRMVIFAEDQIKFFNTIFVLKGIILSMKTDIKDQVKNKKRKLLQNKKMFWVMQKCCLKNEES